jgi:hypothetical protein
MAQAPIIVIREDKDVNVRVRMTVTSGLRAKEDHIPDMFRVLVTHCLNEGSYRLALLVRQQNFERIIHNQPSSLR